jgi:hypothetical protein
MNNPRLIPDRLLIAASFNRVPRIVGYRAAAWLYRLDAIPELQPEFLVEHGTRRRGPFDHQRRRIDDIEIVDVQGVPVTSVRQTLADLCAVVDLDIVERAMESALRLELVGETELREFANLYVCCRHGGPGLRAVLDRRPIGAPATGSDLETRCLQVWRWGGVRHPQRQFPVIAPDGERVATADFGFPPVPFVVETDGKQTHGNRELQYDNTRQNRINDAGYDLRRFTHADIVRRPRYVCRETERGLLVCLTNRRIPSRIFVPARLQV